MTLNDNIKAEILDIIIKTTQEEATKAANMGWRSRIQSRIDELKKDCKQNQDCSDCVFAGLTCDIYDTIEEFEGLLSSEGKKEKKEEKDG